MHSYRLSSYSHTDDRAAVGAIYASARRKGDGILIESVKDVADNADAATQDVQSARKRAHSIMIMRNANAAANRREARAMSRRYRRSR